MVPLWWYVALGVVLFVIGAAGVLSGATSWSC